LVSDPAAPRGDAASAAFGLQEMFDLSLDLFCIATVDGYFLRVNPAFERTLGYPTAELCSRRFYDFVHAEDVERTRQAMEALGRGEELHLFENRYICRDGSVRWLQWNTRPGPADGLVAAAARDVTDSRARKEQAALRRVATLVAHRAPPAEVFNAVVAEAASLLEADFWLIGRYEPDSTMTCLASNGPWPALAHGVPLILESDDPAAQVWRRGSSASVSYDDAPGQLAPVAGQRGLRCAVAAPILVDDKIWGVMLAGWQQPGRNTAEAEQRMTEFTELVATAIANAESRAELVASRARIVAASDDTRRRIERNLHDGAQQHLVTLGLQLRSLVPAIPAEPGQLRADIADIASGLDDVLEELRELSRGIHPVVLATGGLGPALRTLARRAPLPVGIDVHVPVRPPRHIEAAIYYVIAEILTNAAKHSRADAVAVEVEALDGAVRVTASDDGVGGANASRGSGLLGIRDRVDALGGTMSLASPLGEGTSITIQIPVAPREHHAASSS
jgi:PAS domain S-box-containing protein